MTNDLAGRSAVVTGGGSGIGRAVVASLAAAGAVVIAADLEQDSAQDSIARLSAPPAGSRGTFLDVTDDASVAQCFALAEAAGGPAEIVVNCAGVSLGDSGDGAAHEVSPAAWERTIAVNLTGTFLVCRAALPGMLELNRGVIINIASLGALVGIGLHAYSASKGGVVSLSRSLAVTYGQYGIRCNALAPGPIETPMTSDMLTDPGRRQARLATIPAGRAGTPAEVAALVRYLVSDEAGFVTGGVFSIDGGAAAL